jgi:hypothetical protein
MKTGHIPMGNKSKPKNVASMVNTDPSKNVSPSMRVGNTNKDGQMDKPFKG